MDLRTYLVDNWQKAHKFWSLRVGSVGAGLYALFLAFPEHALTLWGLVPVEARTVFPPKLIATVPLLLFVTALVLRLVKQKDAKPITPSE